jgi:polysaccharide export outer membrane protein
MRFTTLFATVAILLGLASVGYAEQTSNKSSCRAYGESEFQLGPGDIIQVHVFKEPDLSVDVPVRPDGRISLPLVNELPATGKTALELQNEITKKLSEYVATPVVTVVVKEVNSAQVSVFGEVKNPGMYKLTNRATVLDAVALAGGFTEYAKRSKVTVIRDAGPSDGPKHMTLNVNDQLKGRNTELFCVLPYDKIYVQ